MSVVGLVGTGSDLGDDVVGRLGHELLVAELGRGLGRLLARGRQILLQPLALGGHVDRARGVDLRRRRRPRRGGPWP